MTLHKCIFLFWILIVAQFTWCTSIFAAETEKSPLALGHGCLGTLGPYRLEVIKRIGRVWHNNNTQNPPVAFISVDKMGKLTDCHILESSGDATLDNKAVLAIRACKFDPLPVWSSHANLKIPFSKVEYYQQHPTPLKSDKRDGD